MGLAPRPRRFRFDGRKLHWALVFGLAIQTLRALVMAQDRASSGHALAFDRTRGQGVCITNFGSFAPTHEITLEFWQKVDAQTDQCIFRFEGGELRNCIAGYGPSRVGTITWQFGDAQGAGSLHYWPPR